MGNFFYFGLIVYYTWDPNVDFGEINIQLSPRWAHDESYIQPSIEFLSENGSWYPKSVRLIGNIPIFNFFKYGVRIGFWSGGISIYS